LEKILEPQLGTAPEAGELPEPGHLFKKKKKKKKKESLWPWLSCMLG
jgi:hypothetical protein